MLTRLGRHYREKNTAVLRRIRAWSGRGGWFFDESAGLQGFAGDRFFFVKISPLWICSKNEQKNAFFTTSSVLQAFLTTPDTTEPDRSRAGIDPQ
ncbi:hypothetical protein EMIT0215P_170096 [Pseudomonas serboccidentalis]